MNSIPFDEPSHPYWKLSFRKEKIRVSTRKKFCRVFRPKRKSRSPNWELLKLALAGLPLPDKA